MSNVRQPAGQGPAMTARPKTSARSIRTDSLLLLLCVVAIAALMMAGSLLNLHEPWHCTLLGDEMQGEQVAPTARLASPMSHGPRQSSA